MDCSGGDEVSEETGFQRKVAALYAVLQEQRAPRTIIFCNKIETCEAALRGAELCARWPILCTDVPLPLSKYPPRPCICRHAHERKQPPCTRNSTLTGRKVENFLTRTFGREDGVGVLPHHAAIADARRDANLRRFLAPPASSNPGRRRGVRQHGSSDGSAERLVLVCTDRASRGLDSAFVEHVVLFDLPRDPSEYLRRVGRTTRGAGASGLVSVLALGRQVKLAKEIIERNQGGLVLHRLPAALPVLPTAPSDVDRLAADLAAAAGAVTEPGMAEH